MRRWLMLLSVLLAVPACSLLLPLSEDEGRPCESGTCAPGFLCVDNICRAIDGGIPDDGTGYSFTGRFGTLSSASPRSSYEVVEDGFEFNEAMCSGENEDRMCAVGGITP